MSKAFTKEGDNDADDDDVNVPPPLPVGVKNYVTPKGMADLQNELQKLMREERPKIVEIVHWAAGNGDRSENGDYIYGKRRLREIDRRVRYLTKQIENAEVVDPSRQTRKDQVFFGATVSFKRDDEAPQTVTIVGMDEADLGNDKISWQSPVARMLMKAYVDDVVEIKTPSGLVRHKVLDIRYN